MYSNQTTMNSGKTSTELNDMLTNFVEYVDSFYGVNDPLYPLVKDGKPLSKVDILGATEKYLSLCAYYEKQDKNWTSDYKVMVWGDGDSLDRERVRDFLVRNYGYSTDFDGGSLWIFDGTSLEDN